MKQTALLLCLFVLYAVLPATSAHTYEITSDSLYRHVAVLAHDSLEGRKVGEPGEIKAANYIIDVFKRAGLEPAGDDGTWMQAFEFTKRIDFGDENRLNVNGEVLTLGDEFKPLLQSASGSFAFDDIVDVGYGIVYPEHGYHHDDYEDIDVEGKAVLVRRFAPEIDNDEVNLERYSSLIDKINNAIEHKASGVIFITPAAEDDTLFSMTAARVTPKDVPVIWLRRAAIERLGLDVDMPALTSIEGAVELVKVRDTGYNVIGFLPGGSDTSIAIGAHYDHLGFGGEGSLYTGPPAVHNGADDNASGVAGLLELARHFAARRDQNQHSMIFYSFSGEESGLLGSSYMVSQDNFVPEKVMLMANMDMVGRLREGDEDKGLIVYGTGTSEEFEAYFEKFEANNLKLSIEKSGIGASDHTSFYNHDIPVLHLFTGPHSDYSKPSDDTELIDFDGLKKVTGFLAGVIEDFDQTHTALAFQKTKAPDSGRHRARFSVTLGIMPDYAADVVGLKVGGVPADRPAERAGIKTGDIIVKMGDNEIGDIYDYMSALGKFRKGDSTMVMVERDGAQLEMPVVFK